MFKEEKPKTVELASEAGIVALSSRMTEFILYGTKN